MSAPGTSLQRLCLVSLAALLPACGPSQQALDETATQGAASQLMTQTAAAPTPTHAPTPAPTRTATRTPTQTGPLFIGAPAAIPMESFSVPVDGVLVRVDIPSGLTSEFHPGREGELTISFPVEDLSIEMYVNVLTVTGLGETSLEQYVDTLLVRNQDQIDNFDLLDRSSITNREGFPVELLAWTEGEEGARAAASLVYVHERRIAVTITYTMAPILWMTLADTMIQSFDTFRVDDQ